MQKKGTERAVYLSLIKKNSLLGTQIPSYAGKRKQRLKKSAQ
jgi:hypothetical protein